MASKQPRTKKDTPVTQENTSSVLQQAVDTAKEASQEKAAEQTTGAEQLDQGASAAPQADTAAAEDVKTDSVQGEAAKSDEGQEPPLAAADSAVADEPKAETAVNEIDQQIEAAIASASPVLRSLGTVFKKYRTVMGKSKGTDHADIVEQNTQLWLVLKAATNDQQTFRDSMSFILNVFRDNQDGAFELKLLLRGIDTAGSRLNEAHRSGYTGLVTLFTTAAGMNHHKGVGKVVDISRALQSEVFSNEARQRVTGFFAS